jgi:hypothetical protein
MLNDTSIHVVKSLYIQAVIMIEDRYLTRLERYTVLSTQKFKRCYSQHIMGTDIS